MSKNDRKRTERRYSTATEKLIGDSSRKSSDELIRSYLDRKREGGSGNAASSEFSRLLNAIGELQEGGSKLRHVRDDGSVVERAPIGGGGVQGAGLDFSWLNELPSTPQPTGLDWSQLEAAQRGLARDYPLPSPSRGIGGLVDLGDRSVEDTNNLIYDFVRRGRDVDSNGEGSGTGIGGLLGNLRRQFQDAVRAGVGRHPSSPAATPTQLPIEAMPAPEIDWSEWGYTPISGPSRDSYIQPYLDAEAAAREAHTAGRGVIEDATAELNRDLNANQEQFLAERAEAQEAEALRREFARQQQEEVLAPSGLAAELGVDSEIAGEAALLKDLAAQADNSQDSLNENMGDSQAQDFQSRLESAEASKANAFANASNNLQALLSQIGLEKAGAERAYEQDAASVQQANAQSKANAQQRYRQFQQEQAEQELKFREQQMQLVDEFSTPAWEAKAPIRRAENPKAYGFTEALIEQVAGDQRSSTAKRAVLTMLPRALALAAEPVENDDGTITKGTRFNEAIIRDWIEEYFSDRKVFDAEGFESAGGDPSLFAGMF